MQKRTIHLTIGEGDKRMAFRARAPRRLCIYEEDASYPFSFATPAIQKSEGFALEITRLELVAMLQETFQADDHILEWLYQRGVRE